MKVHLVEGSMIQVPRKCGHGYIQVQVMAGSQKVKCPHPGCYENTWVIFEKKEDGSFSVRNN